MARPNMVPETKTRFSVSLTLWFAVAAIALLLPVFNVVAVPLWMGFLAALVIFGVGVGVNGNQHPSDRRSESQSLSEGPYATRGSTFRLNPETRTPETITGPAISQNEASKRSSTVAPTKDRHAS